VATNIKKTWRKRDEKQDKREGGLYSDGDGDGDGGGVT
jgi:hypothetical protein